jgi:hypothetical protein
MNNNPYRREALSSRFLNVQPFKNAIIILTVLLSFACRSPKHNNEFKLSDFVIDSISLDVGSYNYDKSIKKVFNHNGMDYLSILDIEKYSFRIYDTDSLQLIFQANNLYKPGKIIDYDIHNFDTIYYLYRKNNVILTDTSGVPIKKYTLNAYSEEFFGDYYLYSSKKYPLAVKDSFLYVFHFPYHIIDTKKKLEQYYSKHLELVICLEDTPAIYDYKGKFPNIYFRDFYNSFNPYRTFANSSEIFSYEISDSIYVYRNDSLIKKTIKSNYYNKRKAFDFSKIHNFNYIKKYRVENPNYEQLIFDRYTNRLYRICKHATNYKNSDGTLNIPGDENWSIVVTDEAFNETKEIVFESEYSRSNIFVTQSGVLVQKKTYTDENKITFIRYIF